MKLFLDRLYRAAKLDVKFYDDVVADTGAMFQSMMAVFVYSMASAYGTFARAGVAGINFGMITTLFAWYVWAFSNYFIGARLLSKSPVSVDRKSVLRALGFASSPGLLRLLGLLPEVSGITLVISSIWMIAAAAVALKQALNFESTTRAVVVCVIGWAISTIAQLLVLSLLLSVFGVSEKPF
jgi:hypothetical protein